MTSDGGENGIACRGRSAAADGSDGEKRQRSACGWCCEHWTVEWWWWWLRSLVMSLERRGRRKRSRAESLKQNASYSTRSCVWLPCRIMANAMGSRTSRPCLVSPKLLKNALCKKKISVILNLRYIRGVLNIDENQKLIAQFDCTLRDERFEHN
jgi:hypothetical protein